MSQETIAVQVDKLSKTFGRQQALRNVTVRFPRGVCALLGENGSGKSTLIKVLAGAYTPDPGASISIWGEPIQLPVVSADVRNRGFRFVHQDLALVQDMTIAENVALTTTFQNATLRPIRWKTMRRHTEEFLERFGLHVDATSRLGELSRAEQTLVAIARAVATSAEDGTHRTILVLDEPTAALPREQSEIVFKAVREASALGGCVIYITHRLEEVFALADNLVVLRDGVMVLAKPVSRTSRDELVGAIVGEQLGEFDRVEPKPPRNEVVVSVRNVVGRRIQDVSFDLREGEVLGVAGLRGAGRSELARLLAGVQRPASGAIEIAGRKDRWRGSRQAIRAGIAYVPEDRRRLGGIGQMSMRENVTLPRVHDFWISGMLRHGRERREVATWASMLRVVPRDPDASFGKLSGGNQQKIVLAKWFRIAPRVLLLDEPTQGIDVGAKAEVLDLIRKKGEEGVGALLISAEFPELEAVCHRVLVLRDGKIAAELVGSECSSDAMLRACYGRAHGGKNRSIA